MDEAREKYGLAGSLPVSLRVIARGPTQPRAPTRRPMSWPQSTTPSASAPK